MLNVMFSVHVQENECKLTDDIVAECNGDNYRAFTNQLMRAKWSPLYMATHKVTDQPAKTGVDVKEKYEESDLQQVIGMCYNYLHAN